jgi:hypothetical protein
MALSVKVDAGQAVTKRFATRRIYLSAPMILAKVRYLDKPARGSPRARERPFHSEYELMGIFGLQLGDCISRGVSNRFQFAKVGSLVVAQQFTQSWQRFGRLEL